MILIVRNLVAVCAGELESVTWNVITEGSVNKTVPLMTPVEGLNDNPPVTLPTIIDHVYGSVPPVALRVWRYGTPIWVAGREMVVIANAGPVTVRVRLAEAVCAGAPESVTMNVTGATIAAVGVPLISPVVALRVKPAGRVPAVNCQL